MRPTTIARPKPQDATPNHRTPRRQRAWSDRGAGFETQRALSDRRKHLLRREDLRHAVGKPEPAQSGLGEDQCVELLFIKLSQSSVDITTNRCDREIGPKVQQLALPPQAAGSHAGSGRKRRQVSNRRG